MGFADLVQRVDQQAGERLGGKVVYTPGVGEPVELDGIFDASYERLPIGGDTGVSSRSPAVFVRLALLTSDPETDRSARVTVADAEYRIHEVQPDSLGGVVLLLHRM